MKFESPLLNKAIRGLKSPLIKPPKGLRGQKPLYAWPILGQACMCGLDSTTHSKQSLQGFRARGLTKGA